MGGAASVGIAAAVRASTDTDLKALAVTLPAEQLLKLKNALSNRTDAITETPSPSWYFAIGSMMNKTALNARGIYPIESKPAVLLDHKLIFRGIQGTASIDEVTGESFHGVMHLCSEEAMTTLDRIESSMVRVPANARCYAGVTQVCTVYRFSEATGKAMDGVDSPPSERYLDIMIEGCKHYGVDAGYIEWLGKQPKVPRTKLEDLKTLPDGPAGESMTPEQLRKHNGVDGERLCVCMNGKVLEARKGSLLWNMWLQKPGSDIACVMSRMTYDPKFGLPDTEEQMSKEQRAVNEDSFVRQLDKGGGLEKCGASVVANLTLPVP